MNLPRFTIDVAAGIRAPTTGSPAASACRCGPRTPARSPATKVVLLVGAVPGNVRPGNSVASRWFTKTVCDVTRSSIFPRPAPQHVVHELLRRREQVVLDRGLILVGRRERREQRGVLRLREQLPDVEPVDDDVGQVRLRRRAAPAGDRSGSRCPPSVARLPSAAAASQRGVGQRAEEQEPELARDLVGGQRRVGKVARSRRRPRVGPSSVR